MNTYMTPASRTKGYSGYKGRRRRRAPGGRVAWFDLAMSAVCGLVLGVVEWFMLFLCMAWALRNGLSGPWYWYDNVMLVLLAVPAPVWNLVSQVRRHRDAIERGYRDSVAFCVMNAILSYGVLAVGVVATHFAFLAIT